MAQDIFGFEVKTGDGFMESEKGIMIANSGQLYLIQQWQVQYQQQVQPIYECGTSTVYWSVKHGSGTLTANAIIGSNYKDIKDDLGWVCEPKTVVVNAYTGQCSSNTEVKLTLDGTILTGVNFSGNAQQAYVAEDLTAMFVGLSVN